MTSSIEKIVATREAITVYCGSSAHLSDIYLDSARAVGRSIAAAGAALITGAGRTGMMGAVAQAAQQAGAPAIGIIPQFMVDRNWHNPQMDALEITPDMHTRKKLMASLAHGCIALPGGIGTFEELTEIITWRQLGLFEGNVVILNIDNYYDPLLSMFATAVEKGFMPADHTGLYHVTSDPAQAVALALAPRTTASVTPKF